VPILLGWVKPHIRSENGKRVTADPKLLPDPVHCGTLTKVNQLRNALFLARGAANLHS